MDEARIIETLRAVQAQLDVTTAALREAAGRTAALGNDVVTHTVCQAFQKRGDEAISNLKREIDLRASMGLEAIKSAEKTMGHRLDVSNGLIAANEQLSKRYSDEMTEFRNEVGTTTVRFEEKIVDRTGIEGLLGPLNTKVGELWSAKLRMEGRTSANTILGVVALVLTMVKIWFDWKATP